MGSWDDLKKELGIEDPTPEERAKILREHDRKQKFYDEWLAKRGRTRTVLEHEDPAIPSEADIKASRKMS